MTTKHTKGPLKSIDAYVYDANVDLVAFVQGWETNSATDAANARLFAAAPELLDALIVLYAEQASYIAVNNLGDVHHNESMKNAAAAIRNATGDTQ